MNKDILEEENTDKNNLPIVSDSDEGDGYDDEDKNFPLLSNEVLPKADFTITSEIDGEGGLTKTGESILALTGNHSYTGDTEIKKGTLQMSNVSKLRSKNVILSGGNWQIDLTSEMADTHINTPTNLNVEADGVVSVFNNNRKSSKTFLYMPIKGKAKLTKDGNGKLGLLFTGSAYTGEIALKEGILAMGTTSNTFNINNNLVFDNNGKYTFFYFNNKIHFSSRVDSKISVKSKSNNFIQSDDSGITTELTQAIDGTGDLSFNWANFTLTGKSDKYSGNIVINSSTLGVYNADNLGTGESITFSGHSKGGVLHIINPTPASPVSQAFTHSLILGSTTLDITTCYATIQVDTNLTATLTGTITGTMQDDDASAENKLGGTPRYPFPLLKSGSGILYLNGSSANTYISKTIIQEGTLKVNANAIPKKNHIEINKDATLEIAKSQEVQMSMLKAPIGSKIMLDEDQVLTLN